MACLSGIKGVCKTRNKWYAKHKGRYIGTFDTIIEAQKAIETFKNTGETARKHKHGGSSTSLYQRWADMKNRCISETNPWFHRYGGRGIKVCQEWEEFPSFKQWAEANGYSKHLVLDRIDNNGDYTPSNCRWATKSDSMYNREFKSKHPGVTKVPCGWKAMAGSKHIGYFDTLEQAQKAREDYLKSGETRSRTIRRKRSDNKSGCPGVSILRDRGKWQAKFKSEYLGQFDTFEAAVNARKEKEASTR